MDDAVRRVNTALLRNGGRGREPPRAANLIAGAHERAYIPGCRTVNGPNDDEALERRGSPTVWSEPHDMGERADRRAQGPSELRRPGHPEPPDDKMLFGVALRRTAGFVERLLRPIGVDRSAPDFGMLRL